MTVTCRSQVRSRQHTVKSVAVFVKFLFRIGLVLDNSRVSCIILGFDGSVDEGYCPSSYRLILMLGRGYTTALTATRATGKTDEADTEELLRKKNSVPHSLSTFSRRDQCYLYAVSMMRSHLLLKTPIRITDLSSLIRDVRQVSGKEGISW